MLASKSIEEHRIGLSPVEKSTRYVYFDKKIDGEYPFYKDEKILKSSFRKEFLTTTNQLFDTYSKIVHKIQPVLKKVFPVDNSIAYNFSIRAKACDLVRGLLPLSALTNMGVYGNGRAFEYLITNLLNDPLEEVRVIAQKMNRELRKVIPAFIKRATNEKGERYRKFINRTEEELKRIISKTTENLGKDVNLVKRKQVKLISWDKNGEETIIATILFERTTLSFRQVLKKAKSMDRKKREKILKAYLSFRENRHHKPGRALEEIYFSFEITADWGVYKDLMRHRLLTRYRQAFTNELGFWIPEELKLTGFEKDYKKAAEQAVELYAKMKSKMPIEAQYSVIHAAYNRFYLKMNLREAVHLCELRSAPQGHPNYRKVAQEIADQIIKVYPTFGKLAFKFVDYQNYHLERLSAFKKLEKKSKKFGVKGFEE
ncbi:MAG: thymidylate synthase [Patescibacteria group bacterium]|nr:MAG: thymidylate synthase [Patescibacteria group bacterium]GIW63160.1 MAG: thymidylate synthase [Patescibacteria group bacterium]